MNRIRWQQSRPISSTRRLLGMAFGSALLLALCAAPAAAQCQHSQGGGSPGGSGMQGGGMQGGQGGGMGMMGVPSGMGMPPMMGGMSGGMGSGSQYNVQTTSSQLAAFQAAAAQSRMRFQTQQQQRMARIARGQMRIQLQQQRAARLKSSEPTDRYADNMMASAKSNP